jgi:hypothetical protein
MEGYGMPVVASVRDERVNVRLSSSANEDLRWLAEKLGVPKTVATAVAIAIGVKTLQRHMAITPGEVEQLLVASGDLPDPVGVPAAPPNRPLPASVPQGQGKSKRRY